MSLFVLMIIGAVLGFGMASVLLYLRVPPWGRVAWYVLAGAVWFGVVINYGV